MGGIFLTWLCSQCARREVLRYVRYHQTHTQLYCPSLDLAPIVLTRSFSTSFLPDYGGFQASYWRVWVGSNSLAAKCVTGERPESLYWIFFAVHEDQSPCGWLGSPAEVLYLACRQNCPSLHFCFPGSHDCQPRIPVKLWSWQYKIHIRLYFQAIRRVDVNVFWVPIFATCLIHVPSCWPVLFLSWSWIPDTVPSSFSLLDWF